MEARVWRSGRGLSSPGGHFFSRLPSLPPGGRERRIHPQASAPDHGRGNAANRTGCALRCAVFRRSGNGECGWGWRWRRARSCGKRLRESAVESKPRVFLPAHDAAGAARQFRLPFRLHRMAHGGVAHQQQRARPCHPLCLPQQNARGGTCRMAGEAGDQ